MRKTRLITDSEHRRSPRRSRSRRATAAHRDRPDRPDDGEGETALWEVATDVTLEGSPTFERDGGARRRRGRRQERPAGARHGGPDDRRALGVRRRHRPLDRGARSASRGPDRVQDDPVRQPRAGDRERRHRLLRRHLLDHRPKRKEQIDFAGPYFITRTGPAGRGGQHRHQRAGRSRRQDRLLGHGFHALQRIRDEYNPGDTVEYDTYAVRRAA